MQQQAHRRISVAHPQSRPSSRQLSHCNSCPDRSNLLCMDQEPCVGRGIVAGQKEMDQQDTKDMKNVLVGRVFRKFQQALLGLRRKVEVAKAWTANRYLRTFEEGDIAGLEPAVQSLVQTISSLSLYSRDRSLAPDMEPRTCVALQQRQVLCCNRL